MSLALQNKQVELSRGLSFVEPHEYDEAKKLIDDLFIELTGQPFTYRPLNYFVTVKIYTRPEDLKTIKMPDGSTKKLFIPTQYLQNDKYESVAALVCAIGPTAFLNRETGEPYAHAPWFSVGSWVHVPRQEGSPFSYRGVPMVTLPDDRVYGTIEGPTDIAVINVADKI